MYLSTYYQLPVSDSVEEAEAQATMVRLHALAKVFRGPVELGMDCKTVTEYLNSDVPTLAPCYGVIQDIKAALSCFPSFKVVFTGRRSLVSFNTKLGKDMLMTTSLRQVSIGISGASYSVVLSSSTMWSAVSLLMKTTWEF